MLKKGKEQRFALRQDQCGCSRCHSFLCSFWSLCLSISAVAASFVQDSVVYIYIYILIIPYEFPEEFPTFSVWQILLIQPGVSNDNRNDNETIAKNSQNPCRPDAGTSLAEKQLFLAHLARPNEQQASTRHGRAQVFPEWVVGTDRGGCERRFLARFPSKTEWKIWKWSFR